MRLHVENLLQVSFAGLKVVIVSVVPRPHKQKVQQNCLFKFFKFFIFRAGGARAAGEASSRGMRPHEGWMKCRVACILFVQVWRAKTWEKIDATWERMEELKNWKKKWKN
ncbi:uncharacterized protein LOC122262684 [Penaeus japonicus]|uniref:uncharacterized protein LOC122262684 n=1 Tax=Penaeus japonicus TaxID=27405 RepID=UPI001C70AFDB|nr:uncharacterized protein LOC122262684 [Penaeus japonicus]